MSNYQQESQFVYRKPSLYDRSEGHGQLSTSHLGLSKLYEQIGAPHNLPADPNALKNRLRTAFDINFNKLPDAMSLSMSSHVEQEIKTETKPLPSQPKKIANEYSSNTIPASLSSQTLFHVYPKYDSRLVYLKYKDQGDWDMKSQCYASYLVNVAALLKNKNPKVQNPKEEEKAFGFDPFQPKDTLQFSSLFESGNLYAAFKVSHNEYDLILQNDINTRGHTQWFFFSVSNTFKGQKVKFNIVNLLKPDSLFNEGMKPAVFSSVENNGWKRDGCDISYYKNNITREGGILRPYFTLSFSYTFKHSSDTVYFAHSFPYTYSDLKAYLDKITNDPVRKTYIIRRSLCSTLVKNDCEYLSITSPSNPETIDERYGIIITARQHPGESLASFMMEGFIDFITSEHPEAQALREFCIFKIVPMLNPDGVIHGNYRTSLCGRDLNRLWNRPRPSLHPTIYYTKEMMRRVQEKRPLHLVCDLHGHSRKKNAFFYGNATDNNPYTARVFPLIMSRISKYVSFEDSRFVVQKSKENTARVALWRELNIPNVFTLEASFHGYNHKGTTISFTKNDYKALGADLAKGILVYLNEIVLPKEEKRFKHTAKIIPPPSGCEHLMNELRDNKQLIDIGNRDEDSGSDTDNSVDDIPAKEMNRILSFSEPLAKIKRKKIPELSKKKSITMIPIKKDREEKHIAFGVSENRCSIEIPQPKLEKPRQDTLQAFAMRAQRLRKAAQIVKVPLARSRFFIEEAQIEGNSEMEIMCKTNQTEGDEDTLNDIQVRRVNTVNTVNTVSTVNTANPVSPISTVGDNKYWLYQDKTPKAKLASPSLDKGGLVVVGAKTAADIDTNPIPKYDIAKVILSKFKPSIFPKELSRSQTAYAPSRLTPEIYGTGDQSQEKKIKGVVAKLGSGGLKDLTLSKPVQLTDNFTDLRIGFKTDTGNFSPIREDKEITERRKTPQKLLENRRTTPTPTNQSYSRFSPMQKPLKRIVFTPTPVPQFTNSVDSKEALISEISTVLNNSKKMHHVEDTFDDSFSRSKLGKISSQNMVVPNTEKSDKKRERIAAALIRGFYVNNRFQENSNLVPKEIDVSPFKASAIKPTLYNEFRAELEQKLVDMGLLKPKLDRKSLNNNISRKV